MGRERGREKEREREREWGERERTCKQAVRLSQVVMQTFILVTG